MSNPGVQQEGNVWIAAFEEDKKLNFKRIGIARYGRLHRTLLRLENDGVRFSISHRLETL